MTTNFNAGLSDAVSLNLTVSDVENLIFCMGNATVPTIYEWGTQTFVSTFKKLYNQTLSQHPNDVDDKGVEKEAPVREQKIKSKQELDPNDNPTVKRVY